MGVIVALKKNLLYFKKILLFNREDPALESSSPLSDLHLDNLWHVYNLQHSYSLSCYSEDEICFSLSLSLLLTVDNELDKCNKYINKLVSFINCLLLSSQLTRLTRVLRVVLERVTHHHTRLRLCNSVPTWDPAPSAFQVLLLLSSLPNSHGDCISDISALGLFRSCTIILTTLLLLLSYKLHRLEDIYSLIPTRVLELLESYLSVKDMDQQCDMYKLHSDLDMLSLVLKFSGEVDWTEEQSQSLREYLQLLSQMFRKYSLNLLFLYEYIRTYGLN